MSYDEVIVVKLLYVRIIIINHLIINFSFFSSFFFGIWFPANYFIACGQPLKNDEIDGRSKQAEMFAVVVATAVLDVDADELIDWSTFIDICWGWLEIVPQLLCNFFSNCSISAERILASDNFWSRCMTIRWPNSPIVRRSDNNDRIREK